MNSIHEYIIANFGDEYTSTVDKQGTRTFHYVRDWYDYVIFNNHTQTLYIHIGNQTIEKRMSRKREKFTNPKVCEEVKIPCSDDDIIA